MTTEKGVRLGEKFLDMQALVGISKHTGGFEATDELLALCHAPDAREVLDAGCGIGVGPVHIVKKHGCHVVGVDISEKMIEWARRRVREARVEAQVELRTADVLALPFEDDRFDVVLCESVLAFVEDKRRAIREFVRVTKPGGYVGLNEAFWMEQPPPEMVERVKDAIGLYVPTVETWQALWETSGLQERIVKVHRITARAEIKSRLEWVGWGWILRAWGRALRLYITNPAARQAMKRQLDVPTEVFQYYGYGLFVGKKQ